MSVCRCRRGRCSRWPVTGPTPGGRTTSVTSVGLRTKAAKAYASVQAKRVYTVELDWSGWSTWRRRAHYSEVVRLVPGWVSTADGGDVNVVVVVGGFVAIVRHPARWADARVDDLPPDHMDHSPLSGIGQGKPGD